ncbi:MAG: hypothetical protein SNF93_02865 [Rikenellaceae bacterium]
MKTTVKFLSALLCAAALVGCTEDLGSDLDVNVDGAAASTLNVTIDSAATKVSLTDADSEITVEWKVGDKISFFNSDAYVCDFECTNASGSFAIVGDSELSSGTYTVVYPATESLDDRGQTDGTTQVQDSSIAHLEDVIYLSGTIEFDAETSNSLNMSHDIALMKISFSPETADAIPTSIQFRNGDEGTYTLNFDDVDAAAVYTSYMVIEPCEATSRTLTFAITYESGVEETYSATTSKAYVAGTCYTAGVEALEVLPVAGLWAEEFDYYSSSTITTGTNSSATNDNFKFLSGSNNINTPTQDGYLKVTAISGNYKSSQSKGVTVGGEACTFTAYYRTDIWGVNEATCPLNANEYPYIAIHLDQNVGNAYGVKYQELNLKVSASSASGGTSVTKGYYSYDDFSDAAITPISLSDGTFMLVFDISQYGISAITTDLAYASDYDTPSELSFNYFMYGYDGEMTAPTYNLYSVQTFASMDDINAYIAKQDSDVTIELTCTDDVSGYFTSGETVTITAVASNGAAVNWTSSDESTATVADGVVTFLGSGDVTIAATTADGMASRSKTFTSARLAYIDGVAQLNNDAALQKFITDFNASSSDMASWGYDAIITNDITASSSFTYSMGSGGISTLLYSGTFDGGGHTISGITKSSAGNYFGLFDSPASGTVIKNLTIANATISGTNQVGAFVGQSASNVLIYNCHLVNSTISGGQSVGGIAGRVNSGSTKTGLASGIIYCTVDSDCKITGSDTNTGGIVGLQSAVVLGCVNNGTVTSSKSAGSVGGITGNGTNSIDVICCYNTGTITATAAVDYVGGIIGNANNGSVVSGCYSIGTFNLNNNTCTYVGGIGGRMAYPAKHISNIWVDYNNGEGIPLYSAPTTYSSSTEYVEDTRVTSLEELYTAANVEYLNDGVAAVEQEYLVSGGNWGASGDYNAMTPFIGAYRFELVNGKIAIVEQSDVTDIVNAYK